MKTESKLYAKDVLTKEQIDNIVKDKTFELNEEKQKEIEKLNQDKKKEIEKIEKLYQQKIDKLRTSVELANVIIKFPEDLVKGKVKVKKERWNFSQNENEKIIELHNLNLDQQQIVDKLKEIGFPQRTKAGIYIQIRKLKDNPKYSEMFLFGESTNPDANEPKDKKTGELLNKKKK